MTRNLLRLMLPALQNLSPARLLALWLVMRTALWTVAVAASHANPPLDLVEWLSWGHALSWGYPKHPPLPAWLAAGAARLSPGEVWGVYFLSYTVTAGTIAAAYRLSREYLTSRAALVAALALDGSLFLTNDPPEFSNNVCLGCGWAWLAVGFHRAFATRRLTWWITIGVIAGLTALCKYTVGVLLIPMAAVAVFTPVGRASLRTAGPYLAAGIAGLIFLPHLLWLKDHEWLTLTYAAERSMDSGWVKHLKNPAMFAVGQSLLLLPVAFVVFGVPQFNLLRGRAARRRDRAADAFQPEGLTGLSPGHRPGSGSVDDGSLKGCDSADVSALQAERRGAPEPRAVPWAKPCQPFRLGANRGEPAGDGDAPGGTESVLKAVPYFLTAAVLGPVVVLLLLSLTTGCQLRQIWGSPLGTFAAVFLMVTLRAGPTPGAYRRWFLVVAAMFAYAVGRQILDPYLLKTVGRTWFPGKQLAGELNRTWNAQYSTPFPIAAGEGWFAGNAAVFSPQRPVLFSSGSMGYMVFEPKHSPWTSDADLNRRGGVVLWDADQLGADATHYIRARFPRAAVQPVIELRGLVNPSAAPVRVGVAFVPPSHPPELRPSEPERQ